MQTLIVHSRRPIFLARPWTSTSGRGDDIDCRSHFWMYVLAGFRGWNDLACADRGQGALSPWREMSDVFTYILALSGVWTILLPALIAAKFRRLKV